jgi:hypothetical protein
MALSDTRRLEHAGLASVVMLLVGAAVASVPDESQPLPDSYGRDNSFLGWFLALLAFGVVALVAARRLLNSFALRSTDGRHRWSRAAAVAVIVVALVARLVMPAPLVLPAPLDMLASLVLPDHGLWRRRSRLPCLRTRRRPYARRSPVSCAALIGGAVLHPP